MSRPHVGAADSADAPRRRETISTGRHRQVVVGALVLAAAFPIRFDLGGPVDSVSLFDLTVVVMVFPYLLLLGVRGSLTTGPPPLLGLGVGLLALDTVSLLWTQDPSATIRSAVSSGEALVVYLIVVGFLDRTAVPAQIVKIMSCLVALLLIPAGLLWMRVPGFLPPAILDPAQGDYLSYFARLSHPFIGRSNNLATLLVFPVIPLAFWATARRDARAGVFAAIALVATLLTFSRGVLAALAVGLALYLFLDRASARHVLRRIALAVGLGLGVLGLTIASAPTVARFLPNRLDLADLNGRTNLIHLGLDMLSESSFLGIGSGVAVDVHNTFLQQFVAFGLLGGPFALYLFYRAGRLWFIDEPPGPLRQARRAAGAAFVVHLITFMTQASYEGSLLKPLIWLWWALASALVAAVEREHHSRDAAPMDRYRRPRVFGKTSRI